MNEDRVMGNAKNLSGQVEDAVGRATGDVKGQVQGKANRLEGALQDAYGQATETAADPSYNDRGAPVHGCRGRAWHRIPDWPLQPPRKLLARPLQNLSRSSKGKPRRGRRLRRPGRIPLSCRIRSTC